MEQYPDIKIFTRDLLNKFDENDNKLMTRVWNFHEESFLKIKFECWSNPTFSRGCNANTMIAWRRWCLTNHRNQCYLLREVSGTGFSFSLRNNIWQDMRGVKVGQASDRNTESCQNHRKHLRWRALQQQFTAFGGASVMAQLSLNLSFLYIWHLNAWR